MYRVFRNPWNAVLVLCIAALVFFGISSIGTRSLMEHVLYHEVLSWQEKSGLLSTILGAPLYDMQSSDLVLLAISLLIGVNITLMVFYIRLRQAAPTKTEALTSVGGMTAAFLGIGCAACGSLVLTSFAASIGGLGLLTLLPYEGAELSYVSIALLIASNVILVRGINKPAVCPI